MDFLTLKDKAIALSAKEQSKIKGGTDTSTNNTVNIVQPDIDVL